MAAKIISFINLKGGVGKTTTTVGTATVFSQRFHKRVLVIDVDPQTNATVMLIGDERWEEVANAGRTLYDVFDCRLNPKHQEVNLKDVIIEDVGNMKDVKSLDLIPSSLRLIKIQDYLFEISKKNDYMLKSYEVFLREIGDIQDNYDYIFIDCPPNLGVLTQNALRISDGYIIPCIPDILSTYGISEIITVVADYDKKWGKTTKCYGIVPTKVRSNNALHARRIDELRNDPRYNLFNTIFLENSKYAEAAEYLERMTMRQRWGYNKQMEMFFDFATEIIERV